MNRLLGKFGVQWNIRQVLAGVIATLITAFILTLFAPIFIQNEYLDQRNMGIMTMAIHMIAVVIGISISNLLADIKDILTPIIISVVWFALTLSLGIVLFEGIAKHTLVTAIGCALGTGSVILLQFRNNRPTKRARKIKKRR